jgi:hypothetical protein
MTNTSHVAQKGSFMSCSGLMLFAAAVSAAAAAAAAVPRHNAKSGKCAACEQPTKGIFNIATDIIKKMKKAKEKEGGA